MVKLATALRILVVAVALLLGFSSGQEQPAAKPAVNANNENHQVVVPDGSSGMGDIAAVEPEETDKHYGYGYGWGGSPYGWGGYGGGWGRPWGWGYGGGGCGYYGCGRRRRWGGPWLFDEGDMMTPHLRGSGVSRDVIPGATAAAAANG